MRQILDSMKVEDEFTRRMCALINIYLMPVLLKVNKNRKGILHFIDFFMFSLHYYFGVFMLIKVYSMVITLSRDVLKLILVTKLFLG